MKTLTKIPKTIEIDLQGELERMQSYLNSYFKTGHSFYINKLQTVLSIMLKAL